MPDIFDDLLAASDAAGTSLADRRRKAQEAHDTTGTGERMGASVKEGLWGLQGSMAGLVGATDARQEAQGSVQASKRERGAAADTAGEQVLGSAIESSPMTLASFLPAYLLRVPASRAAASRVLAQATARGMSATSPAVQRIAAMAAEKAGNVAARVGMGGSMGALSMPDAYDDAKAAGLGTGASLVNAAGAGLTEGAFTYLMPGGVEAPGLTRTAVPGLARTLGRGSRRVGGSVVGEGAEEGGTELAHIAREKALGVQTGPLLSDPNMERVGLAAGSGAIMGPAFEAPGMAEDAARQLPQAIAPHLLAARLATASPQMGAMPAPTQTEAAAPAGLPFDQALARMDAAQQLKRGLPQDFTPLQPVPQGPQGQGFAGYAEPQPMDQAAALAAMFQAPEVNNAQAPQAPAPVAPGPVPGPASPAPGAVAPPAAPVAPQPGDSAPLTQAEIADLLAQIKAGPPKTKSPKPATAPAPTGQPAAAPFLTGQRVRVTKGKRAGLEATISGMVGDRPVLRTDDGKTLGGTAGIIPSNLEPVADAPTAPAAPPARSAPVEEPRSGPDAPAKAQDATPAAAPEPVAPKRRMFQGRGATPEQVYGPEAVAAGRAAPLFGRAQYYADTAEDAKQYGDVTEHDVSLKRPFILDSDAKWKALIRDADAPHLDNMGELFYTEPGKIPAAGEKVQAFLRAKGFDGIEVRLDHNGDSTKRLANMVGHDQTVAFEQSTERTAATTGEKAPTTGEKERASASDPAMVNLPLDKRGGGSLDRQIDRGLAAEKARKEAVIDAANASAKRRRARILALPLSAYNSLAAKANISPAQARKNLWNMPGVTTDKWLDEQEAKAAEPPPAEKAPAEKRPNPAVAKLRQHAATMNEKADGDLSRDRLSNTRKRAEQAASAIRDASQRKADATTAQNLADALERGEVKHLTGVQSMADVVTMRRLLDNAVHTTRQASPGRMKWTDNHSRVDTSNPTDAEIRSGVKRDVIEISVHGAWVREALDDIKGERGAPGIRRAIGSYIGERYHAVTTAQIDAMRELAGMSKRWGDNIKQGMETPMRLRRMGITTGDQLRDALVELNQLRAAVPGENKAAKLEREIRFQKIPGFFPTPPALADEAVRKADIQPGMRVLEPEGGKGDLAQRAEAAGGKVDVAETQASLREILEAKGFKLVGRDMMEMQPPADGPVYDRIVMNPPFENGQDREHVRHAYDLLKPGGRLVAIMSPGPFQRSFKADQEFKAWAESVGAVIEDNEKGSFAGKDAFRQTGVHTVTVTIEKAEEAAPSKQMAAKPSQSFAPERKLDQGEERPWRDLGNGDPIAFLRSQVRGRDRLALTADEASAAIRAIMASGEDASVIFGPISDAVRQRLTALGANLKPVAAHRIDASHLRHAIQKHGTEMEAKRGQVPLTVDDLAGIPAVLENPSDIQKAGDGFDFIGRGPDGTMIVTEVRGLKGGRMTVVTAYKHQDPAFRARSGVTGSHLSQPNADREDDQGQNAQDGARMPGNDGSIPQDYGPGKQPAPERPARGRIPVAPLAPVEAKDAERITGSIGDAMSTLREEFRKRGVGDPQLAAGETPKGAAGMFDEANGVATLYRSNDLDSAAHELGHQVAWKFKIDAEDVPGETDFFAKSGSQAPPNLTGKDLRDYRAKEAWAEYIRAWTVNPEAAEAKAPRMTEIFKGEVPEAVRTALADFGRFGREFLGLPAAARSQANVEQTEALIDAGSTVRAISTMFGIGEAMQAARGERGAWLKLRAFLARAWKGGRVPLAPPGMKGGSALNRDEIKAYRTAMKNDGGRWAAFRWQWQNVWFPAYKRFAQAYEIRGRTVQPENDFRILNRLLAGTDGKVLEAVFGSGMRDSRNRLAVDATTGENLTLPWLLDPISKSVDRDTGEIVGVTPGKFTKLINKALAYGVELRTYGRGAKLIEKAGKDAQRFVEDLDAFIGGTADIGILDDIEKRWRDAGLDPALGAKMRVIADRLTKVVGEKAGAPDARNLRKFTELYGNKVREIAAEKAARLSGIGAGLTSDFRQAQKAIAEREGDPDKPAMDEFLRRYRRWAQHLIQYLQETGVFSEEQAKAMLEADTWKNPETGEELDFYLDMHRIFERDGSNIMPGRSFTGSTKTVRNPLANLLEATLNAIANGDRNRAMASLADAFRNRKENGEIMDDVRDARLGEWGRQVPEEAVQEARRSGRNVVTGRIPYLIKNNGVREFWTFDPWVEASIEAARRQGSDGNLLLRMWGTATHVMRTGITTFPSFMLRNMARDVQSRFVVSESTKLSGLADIFRGYGGITTQGQTEPVDTMRKVAGASYAGYNDGRVQIGQALARHLDSLIHPTAAGKAARVMSPIAFLRLTERLNEWFEAVNRNAEMSSAYSAAKGMGYDDFNAQLYAADKARGLIDFAEAGVYSRQLNRAVLFVNPAVQGLARFVRTWKMVADRAAQGKNVPEKMLRVLTARATIAMALMTAAAIAVRMLKDKDDEEKWRQQDPTVRDFHWHIPIDGFPDIAIPRPYDFGFMTAGAERLADAVMAHLQGDKVQAKRAMEGYAKSAAGALLPINGLSSLLGGFAPLVEAGFNYDAFRQRHIIPTWEEGTDLRLRDTESASPLGKIIQATTGNDARLMDHIIEGYAGNWGRALTSVGKPADWWLGTATGMFKNDPAGAARMCNGSMTRPRACASEEAPRSEK